MNIDQNENHLEIICALESYFPNHRHSIFADLAPLFFDHHLESSLSDCGEAPPSLDEDVDRTLTEKNRVF